MSTKSRKLNVVEQKIHQALLGAKNMTLTQSQVNAIESEPRKCIDAINFLLGTGLIRMLRDAQGVIAYRAVEKKEVEAKKDLTEEELLALTHIQASGNEGIWIKHLKTKTELHQTVINACIKSLLNKKLIKRVENVKYPTRKIYMLYDLEPSSTITGGPWYTDNELDTEFIKLLMDACMKFIWEKSFPRGKGDALYPISAAPAYPTTQQIRAFLQKTRITETELTEEHIEMLLNVLITDGLIERLPAFGAALWDANTRVDEPESDDGGKRRKRKKQNTDDEREKKRRRKSSSNTVLSDSDSESGLGSESGSDEEDVKSENEEKGEGSKRSSAIDPQLQPSYLNAEDFGGAFVYRAIRQEHVALGWSQAPCGRCPQFDFCKDGGPVNPRECHYYDGWLAQAEIAFE